MADDAALWIWDLHPLAPDAWPNRRMATDAPPGAVVDMVNPGGVSESTTRLWGSQYFAPRTTRVVVPDDHRKGYRPTAADLEIMRRVLSDADPENPSWPNVEAELIAGGSDKAELAGLNAPTLLRLLARAHASDEAAGQPAQGSESANDTEERRSKKTGRPSDTDHEEDKRIYDAWQTDSYSSYADCGNALGISGDDKERRAYVRKAVDRERKRRK